ncbi:DNA-binding protein inhibitor ID-1-like [Pollicipes pollicipes]|uniref:DNA-binding protein inhibitor ID-1-like n=1 Tax=Pollicipes pollicipes TaxID=41117 RepID=UPI00188506D1|nr:DNA-binding protein inhibitor ID-1-like [Pollicipes pollicipes]XP_037069301.1 DNA-binding protein inhibitor ID-1-like [Pollicipes pollicipes]
MKSSRASAEVAPAGRQRRRVASYLEQLRQLVPLVPLDRPVSQLEVIQHVIDYISQLEEQLERRQEAPRPAKRRQPLQEMSRNQAPGPVSEPLKQVQPRSSI